ncbi:ABC transporter permease [Corynebacterium uterequi]|uniref:ABC-type nitrate/sulfonate/bicarbonate transport system, permease component n=1 Tax=Corynebacterium uterequi TaxID=1072256 RepID=A0A0G3HFQ7_9CORY|nr:ABC transporter permease [Corynebacterium uterequi]AKK12146.1 ABC-type nitrate/sulfonate/bicarbonate transport system, permease component [Corynebacterium uterequi]
MTPHIKSLWWQPTALGSALFATFLALWQVAVTAGWVSGLAPTPARTFQRGVEILSNPFYRDGASSVGIFWHIAASLRRVLIGFGIATAIAIPLGVWLGSSPLLRRSVEPFVQILRPISPLAWLPLGLALLRNAEATAVFVIIVSSAWPTLLNTVEAVRGIHPTYRNLASTVGANWWQRVVFVTAPAAIPGIVTGMRQSLSTAWLVIIAAEMLVGGRGVGFFVWNMWNRLDVDAIVVALLLIGLVGLAMDVTVASIQKVVRYA